MMGFVPKSLSKKPIRRPRRPNEKCCMGYAQDGLARGPLASRHFLAQWGVGPSPNSGCWIAPQAQGLGSTILNDMIHSPEWAVASPGSVRRHRSNWDQ
jgi:hypothetical protein